MQAVKYLERMLVQANSQTEQQVEVEVKPQFQSAAEVSSEDVEMTAVDADKPAATADICTDAEQSRPVDSSIVKQEPIGDDTAEPSSDAATTAASAADIVDSAEATRPATDVDIKMEVDDGDGSAVLAEAKTVNSDESKASDDQPVDAERKIDVEETAKAAAAAAEEAAAAACSKGINIDPRTYCKLGHFHLLLEDYPKGS